MVSHLVNWEDSTANHLCLSRDEGWHHQAGTVTQAEARFHVEGLKGKREVYAGHKAEEGKRPAHEQQGPSKKHSEGGI